jgi:hypothetical protein
MTSSGKRIAPSYPDSVPKRLCENNEESACCICFDLAGFLITVGVSELIRIYTGWIRRSAVLSIRILESNHNVFVSLKKSPFTMGHPFQPDSVTLHLSHQQDPSQNKKLRLGGQPNRFSCFTDQFSLKATRLSFSR